MSAEVGEGFRLSPQQKHLWLLQLNQQELPYRTACTARIDGVFDRSILATALAQVVDRLEILRTAFQYVEGLTLPLQIISPESPVTLHYHDLAAGPADQMPQALIAAAQAQPFDLAAGNVLHVTLIRLGPTSHLLHLNVSALAADALSLINLLRELWQAYLAGLDGTALGDAPVQYVDIAEWQNELLEAEETAAGRAYWQRFAEAVAQPVTLPFEQVAQAEGPFAPRWLPLPLSADQQTALAALTEQYETSLPAFFLACWQALFWRLLKQPNLIIGTTTSDRKFEELTDVVGLLGQQLPIQAGLAADISFSTLVRHAHGALQERHKWQEFWSWDHFRTLDATQPEPFFALCFEDTYQPGAFQRDSLRVTPIDTYACTDRFKLKLSLTQQANACVLRLHYDPACFAETDMTRLAGRLQSLIADVVRAPDAMLSRIDMLDSAERAFLLTECNQTKQPYPDQRCMHQLFEEQAARVPDAIAVEYEGQQLTYAELDRGAHRLALQLQQLGVRPDVCVALVLERSLDMMIGLLGVLKAGGAYVPLDPTMPPARLQFMLADSQAPVVLTTTQISAQLPEHAATVVLVDQELDTTPDAVLKTGITPDNLAYMIYTSGSTGQPKGVMITHRGLVNYITWSAQAYTMSAGTGTLVHSSLGFDLTVTGLLAPLVVGQRVKLLPGDQQIDGLSQALRGSDDLTLIKLTPAHLDLLSQLVPAAEIAGRVRALVIGGEALWAEHLQFWQQHAPETRLINEYGPTEAVVGCCVYEVPAAATSGSVPIGQPIANTQLYILDEHLQLTPIGVAGELYIGGQQLARGYHGRPALTAEKFIPHMFGGPGERLYRTGDLVRRGTNGQLEYLGRLDHQVKLRGFRVELGEIEAVLAGHPQVREVVVVVQNGTGTPDTKRLIAYVVKHLESGVKNPAVETHGSAFSADLRHYLAEQLPAYMVPSAVVVLDQLPLTANGKVDRRALPEPEQERVMVAPQSADEEILAGIWAQVLRIGEISVEDNYFSLGGDSIRSIQVIGLAQDRGINFTIDQMFKYPTIRSLLRQLKSNQTRDVRQVQAFDLITQADRLKLPADAEDAYPITQLQAGMIFHNEHTRSAAIYHDIFSYHLKLPIHIELLRQAAQQLIQRHPILRTTFDLTTFSEPLQVVHRDAAEVVQIIDIRALSPDEQEAAIRQWIADEKEHGFDVTRLPLLRFQVHLRSAETVQFTHSFHHAIMDGWSDNSLITELFTHYFALVQNKALQLEPPTTHYREFVVLEQEALASKEAGRFWREKLYDSTALELPHWRAPAELAERNGIVAVPVAIPEDVSDGLKQLALSVAVPLKNVLLAAHMAMLRLLSGQQDVQTCIVASGRPETLDGERVLGLFINSIPFRMNLAGGSWQELVAATFAAEQELLPFRRYPMAELKRQYGQSLSASLFYFTHYHILQSLHEFPQLEVLDMIPHEVSSFGFVSSFALDPFTSQVKCQLICRANQFDAEQTEAMAEYYRRVLLSMSAMPQQLYQSAALLPAQEVQRLLVEWNATTQPYDDTACIHHVFEEQARRTPDAPAVVLDGDQLTYGELNARANQLAHYLQTLGAGPETLVGLCMRRSLDMMVGLLGVLKAGGAYVPLDPTMPPARLQFMLADSQAPILLTVTPIAEQLRASDIHPHATIVCLDAIEALVAQQPTAEPVSAVSTSNLAYVIYTSGSTGRPKGVALAHGGIANLVVAQHATFDIQPHDRVIQIASLSFDASLAEIMMAWHAGAALYLAPAGAPLLGAALSNFLREQEITVATLPPSALSTIPSAEMLPALRVLCVAGEACPANLAEIWGQRLRFFNLYGPTETTIWATAAQCHNGQIAPPIGRPIANVQVLLLDALLQPVATGVPGEIYIASCGLARGYLNQPGLTAERFLPNPFSSATSSGGERLYRTGDVARYRIDGQLEFLGRVDRQVKLRGFRIELTEIEAVLNQDPSIQQSVVTTYAEPGGDLRLVAYIVARPNAEISYAGLQALAQAALPAYMVPSMFITADAIPLTTSGKIDYRALPEFDAATALARPNIEKAYVAPRTPVEQYLSELIARILGLQQVGVDDNFFALGGDSIKSLRISAAVRERYQLDLPLQVIFEEPTIVRLAEIIHVELVRRTDDISGTSSADLDDDSEETFL